MTPTKKTIMVVDEEEKSFTDVREFLEREGYEVIGLRRAKQAMTAIATFLPDLVLMDAALPRLSEDVFGAFFAKAATHGVPVVLYAADAKPPRGDGARHGVRGFVRKGDATDLRTKIFSLTHEMKYLREPM